MRPYPFFAMLLLAFTGPGWTQGISIEGRIHDASVDKDGRKLAAVEARLPSASAELEEAPEVRLEPLEAEQAPVTQRRTARRVGRVRTVAADAAGKGTWSVLPDGRWIWRLSILSPEASQLRVHFTGFQAGAGKVWVYSDDRSGAAQEFTGDGIYGDGDFWTSAVAADRVTIEFMAEDGSRGIVPFQIAEVGHLWETTAAMVTMSAGGPSLSLAPPASRAASGSSALGLTPGRELAGCHLDVACYPEYRTVATGIARIFFAETGGLYVCSGALVNTKSGIGTPLFLTASHCIDNEEAARSVEANFFFQSESCGGGYQQSENVLGANYLVSETFNHGDYSLIRLLGLPKTAVHFAGITTEEPAIGAKLTGIHHPEGSHKRITFGTRVEDETIAVSDDGTISVSPADRFYQILENQGRTEGGSSGSPLFNGSRQIVGTLSSGPVFSSDEAEDEVLMCIEQNVVVQYGRISKAWSELEPFINDLRPARMALPQVGDKFTSKKVTFRWSPGVGVSEYRLLAGKNAGGADYADLKLSNLTSAVVDNLPEDGSRIFVRLMSLVEGKWEIADYAYLASSGSVVRAARIITPTSDGQLDSSRVEFTWDEGSNVSEYMLYVGTTPGGIEFARANLGQRTSAVVENLPGNGQTVYARLFSRAGEGWIHSDAVYRAADTHAKTFTLRIANQLAYPVSILVNERPVMSVLPGRTSEQNLPRTGQVMVEWRLVRPAHPVTGIALGESLSGAFAAVVPAESLSYEITNIVNGAVYFTPVVTNSSNETFYVEVNPGTPARAALGAIPPGVANAGLGYHRVQLTGSVRSFYGLYGYSGPYIETAGVAGRLEPGSGVVRVNLATPAQ